MTLGRVFTNHFLCASDLLTPLMQACVMFCVVLLTYPPQGPPPEGVPEVSFRLDISAHLKKLGNDAYKQVRGGGWKVMQRGHVPLKETLGRGNVDVDVHSRKGQGAALAPQAPGAAEKNVQALLSVTATTPCCGATQWIVVQSCLCC